MVSSELNVDPADFPLMIQRIRDWALAVIYSTGAFPQIAVSTRCHQIHNVIRTARAHWNSVINVKFRTPACLWTFRATILACISIAMKHFEPSFDWYGNSTNTNVISTHLGFRTLLSPEEHDCLSQVDFTFGCGLYEPARYEW